MDSSMAIHLVQLEKDENFVINIIIVTCMVVAAVALAEWMCDAMKCCSLNNRLTQGI